MNLDKMGEAFLSQIHMLTDTIQHGSQKQSNMEVRNNTTWQSGTLQYGNQEQCNMEVKNNTIWKSGTMQYRSQEQWK